MNVAFIIICFVVVIALAFFAYQGLRNVEQVNNSKNTYVLDLNEFGCYPEGSITNLPDVGNTCCLKNNIVTNLRKYNIPGYNLEVLTSDYVIPYQDACYGFCVNIDTVTGECLDIKQGLNNGDYAKCIQAIQPVTGNVVSGEKSYGCTQSALPVARLNETPYYVIQPNTNKSNDFVIYNQYGNYCDKFVTCKN
jgi:hypothetical protein